MINIFLSYAEEDRETARKLSEALASIGWSVGWERDIPAGKDWRTMLEEAAAIGLSLPLTARALDCYDAVAADGLGASDATMLPAHWLREGRR